jgi:GntR family transcriptional regulator
LQRSSIARSTEGEMDSSRPRATGGSSADLPAYLHVANTISDRVASGRYGPGSCIPSESQFCAEFGVSHMTLRKALTIVADKGLVLAQKGRGTFVRSFGLSDSVFTLESLTREWSEDSTEVRLLSASTIRATEQVAGKLAIPPGDRVVYMRRVALHDQVPAMYHTEYVVHNPREPLSDSRLRLVSLHGLRENTGDEGFPRGTIALCALTLSAAAARILNQPTGAPALSLEHLFQDVTGRPLSWGRVLLPADLFALQTNLGPT